MYTFASPLGNFTLVSNGASITKLWFMSDLELGGETDPIIDQTVKEIKAYFGGQLQEFSFPIEVDGTDFSRRVYQAMRDIPYGKTMSYGQLAAVAGNPKASRAVGMVNHRNPLPLIQPCHRVIGSTGKMVGFAGGIWLKEALLALEQHQEYYQWLTKNELIIRSFGVASPIDFYYDQPADEVVRLTMGQARLWMADRVYELSDGDELLIPAHVKHRVEWTSWDCVWHCIFKDAESGSKQ